MESGLGVGPLSIVISLSSISLAPLSAPILTLLCIQFISLSDELFLPFLVILRELDLEVFSIPNNGTPENGLNKVRDFSDKPFHEDFLALSLELFFKFFVAKLKGIMFGSKGGKVALFLLLFTLS